MLIGLCGYARCGKDSVADCLKGFKKLAFASALKREVQRNSEEIQMIDLMGDEYDEDGR